VLGQSILRLLPSSALTSGSIVFEGKNLLEMSEKEIRAVRGKKIAYINQNPTEALNPVLKIGTQLVESLRVCGGLGKKEAKAHALDILASLSFEDPADIMNKYPMELSGGMKQRALTAMAMGGKPPFLIADEPTKGLDALIRGQVIDSLMKFVEFTGCSGLIITHDLKFASAMCNTLALMYAGEIVEYGPAKELFASPKHPYLKALLASMPQNGMHVLKGNSCSLIDIPSGCRFASRCEHACEKCRAKHPEMLSVGDNRMARCLLYD
jgi:peptide/nickel transport system ATP-binding protein